MKIVVATSLIVIVGEIWEIHPLEGAVFMTAVINLKEKYKTDILLTIKV